MSEEIKKGYMDEFNEKSEAAYAQLVNEFAQFMFNEGDDDLNHSFHKFTMDRLSRLIVTLTIMQKDLIELMEKKK